MRQPRHIMKANATINLLPGGGHFRKIACCSNKHWLCWGTLRGRNANCDKHQQVCTKPRPNQARGREKSPAKQVCVCMCVCMCVCVYTRPHWSLVLWLSEDKQVRCKSSCFPSAAGRELGRHQFSLNLKVHTVWQEAKTVLKSEAFKNIC